MFDATAWWTFSSNNVNYGWGVSSAPKGVEGDLGGGLLSHTGEMSTSASEIWTLCHGSLIGTLLIPKSRSQKGVLLSVDTPETCLVWSCFALLLKMALTQLWILLIPNSDHWPAATSQPSGQLRPPPTWQLDHWLLWSALQFVHSVVSTLQCGGERIMWRINSCARGRLANNRELIQKNLQKNTVPQIQMGRQISKEMEKPHLKIGEINHI